MSDATLPPRSSSAEPVEDMANGSDLTLPGSNPDTLREDDYVSTTREDGSGDSAGGTDNKQKRKRTSPKDQAVLEAEYKQNPKPNKAARAEIVEKVDLNEKEVQIWFQNRRQINRRKSRPLLPHEIVAFGLGGMAALSSDQDPGLYFGSSQNLADGLSQSQSEPPDTQDNDETGSFQDETEVLEAEPIHEHPMSSQREKLSLLAENAMSFMPTTLERQGSGTSTTDVVSGSVDDSVVKSFSSTPGYLANRWNNFNSPLLTPPSSHIPTSKTPPIFSASQPTSCPGRIDESIFTPQSSIRLSLSLDGKAELITSSPSPPHQRAQRPIFHSPRVPPARRMGGPLQRSQSAYSLSSPATPSMRSMPSMAQASPSMRSIPSATQASRSFVSHLPAGRSMDARTWESCCESEPRDALTMQAENESQGSAVAAISLIRSTSSSALKPNNNKRNASSLRPDTSKQGKKAKFGRAQSSLARLQSTVRSSKHPEHPSSTTKDGLMRSPSGDSDKENWEPNEGGRNPRRRPLPSSRASRESSMRAAVLGDNHTVVSHANFGANKGRKRKAVTGTPRIFEDQDENGQVPGEVEEFMRGPISPSKRGDLDCVQGLLSLSQGNWR